MSLEYLSKSGEDLFSVPPVKRDGRWAYGLDNLRREILFRVTLVFPSAKEVRQKTLPFFYRSIQALNDIELNPSYQDPLSHHIPGFLKNFQEGARELEQYAKQFQKHDVVCF